FITGHEDLQARYPDVVEAMKEAGFSASASVPVSVDHTTVAVLNLMFRSRRGFGEHDRTFLMTMAEMLSQALRRTWLFESEQHARIDAEAANRAKTEFLAVMSHELRTPLNAIIGYAQILEHGIHGDLNPQQYRDIDRLQHSAQHLLALLNHVIGFAQLERDHVLLDLGAVPVHGLIAEVHTLVAEQVAARSQQLIVAQCDPALVVRGDRDKIALVLLNLLMNATRHTPVGGAINVWCERVGQRAMIKVQDSGMGVPADQLERVFEPFVQLGRGLTGTHEGTGLGLAIGRELARRMGGDLHAENEPGEGGRFVVTLPLWLVPELDPPV
ncbi:MAG: sensor histidine kinase, partial [Longimicrobiales bacterium]